MDTSRVSAPDVLCPLVISQHVVCFLLASELIQIQGNYPEESIQHSEHSESLKSRIFPNMFINFHL